MKSSSGRVRGVAHIGAAAFSALSRAALRAPSRTSFAIALGAFALLIAPAAPAFAQKTDVISHGPATRDMTPDADASIQQKNWNAALKQLDARIAQNPRDAQAKFKRATVLARLNRDDDAIAAFTELTETYPELPEPYNNLAALYAKEGRYSEARAALETATKASPGYGLAYENLGDLYLRLADQAYRRAQGLGRASGTTQQRLADIEKIITPRQRAQAATSTAAPVADYTNRATSNITDTPGFQFGGPSGSLAIPPYVAPSQ